MTIVQQLAEALRESNLDRTVYLANFVDMIKIDVGDSIAFIEINTDMIPHFIAIDNDHDFFRKLDLVLENLYLTIQNKDYGLYSP